MNYELAKKCKNCANNFKANSNSQLCCLSCRPLARQKNNKKWQNTYYMKNKQEKLIKTKKYNKSEKGIASQKLRSAVRYGKIVRQPCEVCQTPKAQGHHTDYSKPLDVKWLCPKHHREEHLFEPWQNNLRRAGYNEKFDLKSLIEACGNGFDTLYNPCNWWAGTYNYYNKYWINLAEGNSPEEAVANLYLELKKK